MDQLTPASKGTQKVLVSLQRHKKKERFQQRKKRESVWQTTPDSLLLKLQIFVVMVRNECEHAEICVCLKDRIECDNLS
jgi:hypothetical protein